jgi:DNA-binding MarR family transcriptional regulator
VRIPESEARDGSHDAPFALGRLDSFVGYHLRLAQLRSFDQFAVHGPAAGFGPAAFSAMLLIEANSGINQAMLAAALRVDRSTIVRMIDKLVDERLVRRSSRAEDRRVSCPELTPKGRALLERAVRSIRGAESAALAPLTDEERRTLHALLRKSNARAYA